MSYSVHPGSSRPKRMRDKLILIGVGGNLASPRFGAPPDTLAAALVALEAEGVQVATRSAWYRTEPVPHSDQPWFVNAVASLITQLAARDLLTVLEAAERQFGRVRGELGYQRRDRVNEPRLVRVRYRLSSIPGRSRRDLDAFCFERNQRGCERIGGRAEPRAGQIAADTDQDQFVSHTLRLA